jgi:transposase
MKSLDEGSVTHFEVNGRHYSYVKKMEGNETLYIFFCPKLYQTHIESKEKRFEKQKKKGNALLKKRKVERIPSDKGWIELIPHIQKTLYKMDNPYINGLEGFFILESSVNDDPKKILRLYKKRDNAEKFIRALKEGIELRPIRHWNKWAVIGIFFISFLTNFLINLTPMRVLARFIKTMRFL